MARVIMAQYPGDLYLAVQWSDTHHHSKRVTEHLAALEAAPPIPETVPPSADQLGRGVLAACKALIASRLDVVSWELRKAGTAYSAHILLDGEDTRHPLTLSTARRPDVITIMEWAEREVAEHLQPQNSAFEEEKRLEREKRLIDTRLDVIRGGRRA